jgi:type I restriction enzyme, R subunit
MKHISLTWQDFSPSRNGKCELQYTRKALLRAVIAAGQRPEPGSKTTAARADIAMRVNAVVSSLDMSGTRLAPTPEYLSAGSTDRAHKSYYVGNALCAHAAYAELDIPWLLDIERLDNKYNLTWSSTRKRPDFLGWDVDQQWYIFESKGRKVSPSEKKLGDWKTQAKAITHVNSMKVQNNIVSAAYLRGDQEWMLKWVDPITDEENIQLNFEPFSFFEMYYDPIMQLIDRLSRKVSTPDGTLSYIPSLNAYIGLHKDLLNALQERNINAIISYASNHMNMDVPRDDDGSVHVFADGMLVALEADLSDSNTLLPQNKRGGKNASLSKTRKEGSMVTKIVGQPERETQNRLIALFRDELHYRYLGDWTDRDNNSNIDEGLLTAWLTKCGYTPAQINTALYKLRTEAYNHNRTLYGNNRAVYSLLRYGVPVKIEAGKVTETVHLINWRAPEKNDFAIAEEVTLKGNLERRPDIVLYLNGIAIGVLELKNSRISIGDGIRQNLSNQQPEFNEWFFSTVQFVFAGNDSEGLKYGTTGTPEKYFLNWKEDEQDNTRFKLDKYLLKLCQKDRLIELMRDFILFDAGVKKLPRAHQYFGIKFAQEHVRLKQGGIIWHTQGSGKSIVMVLLAKWILENNPHARVAIITDRDELDKQIEGVFSGMGEKIQRTSSGRDLMKQLGQATPRLICSLIHKFGRRDVDDFEAFIKDLEAQPSPTIGEVFVFVDECHRTQSGKLHRVMKALMPNAVFIGFTGTPLLLKDKQTSLEVFGSYIHTYTFKEGVEDGVILDLVYEARDIDQRLGSKDKIDAWFEAKTKGLNDWQKDELKKQWGTLQNVLSSRSRMDRVVNDIVFDFSVKPRLSSERGNAILVASSIYEVCKYFSLFQKTPFKGKCAVITSYNPQAKDVTLEETGANTETDKQFIYNTYNDILKAIEANPGMTKTETYEDSAKDLFKKEPANMKLLVVVNKLLVGFDAPPCTYLYIDKSMQDHGLFQAICRVNRLDGEDKDFGFIVDYKNLFPKVQNAIEVYTSELDHSAPGVEPDVLMQSRLQKGRERLDNAIETLVLLCEPVEPPEGELQYIHYFCGNTEIPSDLAAREPQRVALYKATVALIRAYANISDELDQAGYTPVDIKRIKATLEYYLNVREIIRKASGETLDLKPYEADMRHLIDTYIEADEPRKISPFDNIGLLELIKKTGIADAINRQLSELKGDQDAIAEIIENNVRRKIIRDALTNPVFYEKMSALLDEIIAARKAKAIEYESYLKKIAEVADQVQAGQSDQTPSRLNTPGKRALWDNLGQNEELALKIDETVHRVKPDDFRGTKAKENMIKRALLPLLGTEAEVERIFLIIMAQKEY